MVKEHTNKIIAFPHPPAGGGPGSFQSRFEEKLKEKGWKIVFATDKIAPSFVMIVGGTRRIFWLLQMKFKGVPVIYRLDGIAWLHKKKKVTLKNYLIAEVRNLLSKIIHAFIADFIIYQSKFVENWWKKKGWLAKKNKRIIYNGVQLVDKLNAQTNDSSPNRLVILEGNIDYSPYAIQLLNDLADRLPASIKMEVYGKFEDPESKRKLSEKIIYKGFVAREKVNEVLTGSVYLSLDINPACPNTVIEALSCAAPVVAFDTGSLRELVDETSGIIVPYGSDPWQLEYPDVNALNSAIVECFDHYEKYSTNARLKFVKEFTIDQVVNEYLNVIYNLIPDNHE